MNIALIDDHKMIAESLKSALELQPDVNEVRVFFDAAIYLEASKKWLPDLIITDMLMPGMKGHELISFYKNITDKKPNIIVLSSVTDVQSIKSAMRNGAKGYLGKDSSIEELFEAVKAVMVENKNYISERLGKEILNSVFVEEGIVYHLSNREKELLDLVCQGFTTKEAAFKMELSYHTIQFYHRNLMKKLKVNRTADLIIFAINNGLYKPEIKNL